MFTRSISLLGLLAFMLFTLAPYAHAQDIRALPNVDSLDASAKRVTATYCDRPACRAIALIDQVVQLQLAGSQATVGRPRPIPRGRDAGVAVSYRKLVRQGRSMKPDLCTEAARLLSDYGLPTVASEVIVPVAVLDFTSRLDVGAPNSGCTRTVIRAMPASSAANTAIYNAHALCIAQGGDRRCAAIAR